MKKILIFLLIPTLVLLMIILTAVASVYQILTAGGNGKADMETVMRLPLPLSYEIVDAAMTCERNYGVKASVIMAVLYERGRGLEEGGKGVLASEINNYFQMKGTGTKGSKRYSNYTEVYEIETDDEGNVISEKTRILNGRYRKYRNYAESMDDFCKLITKKKI